MQKKGFIAVLSAIVLMIVASVSLVLAVGHNASAAHDGGDGILTFNRWDDFNIDENGVLYGFSPSAWNFLNEHNVYDSSGTLYWYGEGNEVKGVSLVIPEGVKEIYDWAFGGDDGGEGCVITSVKFPSSLEKIDIHAFMGCDQLTSVVIPNSVQAIDYDPFAYCVGLVKIYCEVSEKPDGWDENWNFCCSSYYDNQLDQWIYNRYFDVVWNCNKTITFDTDGGNNVADQTVCVDSLVTKPADPEKAGYEFKGWFDNNGDEYDFTTPVTADMTLTAQWEAIPEQPEPSNPEQPTTPDTDTETVTVGSKNGFNIGAAIGGGLVAGLGTISAIAATIIARRRHK